MLDRVPRAERPVERRKDTGCERPSGDLPTALWIAIWRGFRGRCAPCGTGRMFRSFLQPVEACSGCGLNWRTRTADDFPPYLVILLTGHIVAPLMILVETQFHPPLWVHLAIWLPIVTILAFGLIQPAKGAVMAFQWWHWDFRKPGDGEPISNGGSEHTEQPRTIESRLNELRQGLVECCSGWNNRSHFDAHRLLRRHDRRRTGSRSSEPGECPQKSGQRYASRMNPPTCFGSGPCPSAFRGLWRDRNRMRVSTKHSSMTGMFAPTADRLFVAVPAGPGPAEIWELSFR
jgi:uncharacterized protein (DUF983 family)